MLFSHFRGGGRVCKNPNFFQQCLLSPKLLFSHLSGVGVKIQIFSNLSPKSKNAIFPFYCISVLGVGGGGENPNFSQLCLLSPKMLFSHFSRRGGGEKIQIFSNFVFEVQKCYFPILWGLEKNQG